jgi:peptidoglycan/xylan/chitin deacetylase (PgdA/CDA1 family)
MAAALEGMEMMPVTRLLRRLLPALLLAASGSAAWAKPPEIAFTFDDLPAHSSLPPGVSRMQVAKTILATWKAQHMPPVWGFVNGVREVEEPGSVGVLAAWRAAGMPLGNHTWTHMKLDDHPLADWEADLLKDEPLLARHMAGRDWHWLRFPNLAEGGAPEQRAGARAFLAAHGYRIAAVAMSFRDYDFNAPYARCAAKGDAAAIDRLERTYLEAAALEAARARKMSHTLYGRDIPYVLLMHLGAFDARMIDRLIAQYRAEGFGFATLEAAERDPFYDPDIHVTPKPVPDTLEEALKARGLPAPKREPNLDWLATVCS